MFGTYLRRELAGRRKQTVIVASGLAVAVALVVVGNALTTGVHQTQDQALQSLYGVGTDLTVTGAAQQPGQRTGQRFEFGAQGTAEPGATGGTASGTDGATLSSSRLMLSPGRSTVPGTDVATIASTTGVKAASASLRLNNIDFSGQVQSTQGGTAGSSEGAQAPAADGSQGTGSGTETGGRGRGFGGGAFNVDSTSVLGVDDAASTVGPLASVAVTSGRALAKADSGTDVAVVDATYATSSKLAVGGTVTLGGTDFKIVGIVSPSSSGSADTAADVYVPLDQAQKLAGTGDVVSTVYVQSDSAANLATVQSAIEKSLPTATVSSQAQLASTVSGSLASASSLISSLGLWLSVALLVAAVAVAILFTLSGVSRRTRELGTLKAIGWSNGQVVRQVAGESVVQGVIGGIAGAVLGIGIAVVLNVVQPTVSLAAGGASGAGAGRGFGGQGGFGGSAARVSELTLQAPLSVGVILLAVALAVVGGLVAGGFGGWRAARLRPAEALRSVG